MCDVRLSACVCDVRVHECVHIVSPGTHVQMKEETRCHGIKKHEEQVELEAREEKLVPLEVRYSTWVSTPYSL